MWRLLAIIFIPLFITTTFRQQPIEHIKGAKQQRYAQDLICARRRDPAGTWIAKLQAAQCTWNKGRRPFVADANNRLEPEPGKTLRRITNG